MHEKRQHPRAPYGAWVTVKHGEGNEFYLARDLSLGGIYLVTQNPLPTSTPVKLLLLVEGDKDPIEIDAEVVRHEVTGGFGVRFKSMTEDAAERLFALFKSLKSE